MPAPLLPAGAKMFSLVIAATHKGGIGKTGSMLPWRIPEDMKFFAYLTQTVDNPSKLNAVIMGRVTYESLPDQYKPLPKRLNIIISSTLQQRSLHDDGGIDVAVPLCVSSLSDALQLMSTENYRDKVEQIFVVGGKRVYEEALKFPNLKSIYLTRVQGRPSLHKSCDVSLTMPFPDESIFTAVSVSKTRTIKELSYDFVQYERISVLSSTAIDVNAQITVSDAGDQKSRASSIAADGAKSLIHDVNRVKNFIDSQRPKPQLNLGNQSVVCCPSVINRQHEEFQYLDLVAEIISDGFKQMDRTGVGTLTKLGVTMRFDLSESFPLLTTKDVFWRGVVEELLWFIRGDTNSNNLSAKGIKIWDANGSREFLDQRGLKDRQLGDLGPIYGFQWRHFGAQYKDMNTDYRGEGVDQLRQCINMLKTDPNNRRIIMSAWNPVDLDAMALPPCHLLTQFFVTNENKLSCIMYQRSCDMGLGVPFNIASYSLLCCMVAQVCGLQPGEFIHVLGNAHVYLNHIEPLKEQLTRVPRPFPILKIDPSVQDIDDFTASHFELIGYSPFPKIPMAMAV